MKNSVASVGHKLSFYTSLYLKYTFPLKTSGFLSISFSYLNYQRSGRQILRNLRTVAASSEHRRVVVHVRHVDDNRGDVIEGRLAATSLEREVVLPGNFKVQRRDEDQKACKTTGVKTELFF